MFIKFIKQQILVCVDATGGYCILLAICTIAMIGMNTYLLLTDQRPPVWLVISITVLLIIVYARMVHRNNMITKKTHCDFLTSINNREYFLYRMKQFIDNNTDFHLLVIDLNRFKFINDNFGHAAGDKILTETALKLQQAFRKEDIIARLGGDEFGVLIPNSMSNKSLAIALRRAIDYASTPIEFNGKLIHISFAIGAATFKRDSLNMEDLMQKADAAMYVSKNEKRDYCIFDEKKYINPKDELSIIEDLKNALIRNELTVVYQPKYSIKENRVISCEALSRWNHPTLGNIAPDKFIHLAEQEGLINQLLQNLLAKVFDDFNEWRRHDINLTLGINVSADNLSNMEIITEIMQTAKDYDIDLSKVTLEVTETAIMKDPEEAIKYLVMLNSLGIKLSIDDFGTGNSSFIYLKHLPISEIKIDKTFIKDMLNGNTDLMIIASTIHLAKSCGIIVVAEGVELEAQLDMLREYECDVVQGFYISKPLPQQEFIEFMKAEKNV